MPDDQDIDCLSTIQLRWEAPAPPRAGGYNRIAQKTGDRHQPYAARNRRDVPSDLAAFSEMRIADQSRLAFALLRRIDAIDAYLYDAGAWFDPIATHHLRAPHRGHEDVGRAAERGQVPRPRMSDGHRAVLREEKKRSGFPNKDRAAKNHNRFSRQIRPQSMLREDDAPNRGARLETGLAEYQARQS